MASLRNPAQWLIDALKGGKQTDVTEESILGSPAVWYAINTIAGDVAKMPFAVKHMVEDDEEEYKKHAGWKLMNIMPNRLQTPDLFREQLQGNALGWGNGRAAIIREGRTPKELIPLQPDRTTTIIVEGEKYHVTKPLEDDPIRFRNFIDHELDHNALLNEECVVLHDDDVLHIQGFSYNGWSGISVAMVLKQALGIDIQSQEYSNNGMRKGFAGEIALEVPPGLLKDEDEARKFKKNFDEIYTREGMGSTTVVLREGVTARVLNMSPTDSQFIEQRAFSRQDIMMIFGMQHIPGDDSSVSYNSLEHKQLAYLASCLDKWLVRWEMECNRKLLNKAERDNQSAWFEFNRETWLRTDIATKEQVASSLVSSMIINRNEARAWFGKNPVEGGDEFINPNTSAMDEYEEVDVEDDSMDDAIENRLEYLIQLEKQRAIEACKKKDFIGAVEDFYSKWPMTLLNNNIPADTVSELVRSHKDGLVDAGGRATTPEQLEEEVRAVIAGWSC